MWLLIQDQILKMKWLNVLVERLLRLLGVNPATRIGGSLFMM